LFFLNERAAYYTVKEVRLRLSIYISNNNKRENNSTDRLMRTILPKQIKPENNQCGATNIIKF